MTPLKASHTPPTYLSLGLTKTSRLAANVNVTHCGSDSSQTNCAVRTVGSLNPWMASRLITMKSIIVVGITRWFKRRRTNRSHNFRYYLDKHLKICNQHGHNLSDETIQRTNETFQFIEEHLPTRISMPFVAYKLLKEIVPNGSQHVILNYFWLQVPQSSVGKHEEKWQNMLRQFDA